MKYKPLYGQPSKLYEIHTTYMDNSVNYMKYLHIYMDNTVNYMKYTPLYGQPRKLYKIHPLTGTTL